MLLAGSVPTNTSAGHDDFYRQHRGTSPSHRAVGPTDSREGVGVLVLNISVDGLEFSPGLAIRLKTTVRNTGTEEVLLEYFAGQLFEVMIRDESGRAVYVHSDKGFQR
jgi:hypothetical protein